MVDSPLKVFDAFASRVRSTKPLGPTGWDKLGVAKNTAMQIRGGSRLVGLDALVRCGETHALAAWRRSLSSGSTTLGIR